MSTSPTPTDRTALPNPRLFPLAAILPGAVLIAMTLFEVLVIFLQAYIFTILAAVYIGGAIHPEH